MEGLKEENWWVGDYPQQSLKNYKSMPVYQKFCRSVQPFTKVLPHFREAFWKDDNCYIYEWYDQGSQKGEKFGLDYNSITYFYEHWYTQEDFHIVDKSWLREPVEWGVSIKYFPEYEEEVDWTIEEDKKVIENITRTEKRTEGKKKGEQMTPEGLEDFTETFWKTPTDSGREKQWTKGTAVGEDKEYKEGDKKWGESWSKDVNQEMSKEWHEEDGKKWGEGQGKFGYETWKETWEKNSQGSLEEVVFEDRDQKWGKLRKRSKSNEYKLEWSGVKPEVVDGENQSKKKKDSGKSGNSEGEEILMSPSKVSALEKTGFQISALFNDLAEDLKGKIGDLQAADVNKLVSPKLKELMEELESLKNPKSLSPDDGLEAIQRLRKIDEQAKEAEKALLGSIPNADSIKNLFVQCKLATSLLQPLLDSENISEAPLELHRLAKNFEKAEGPNEKLRVVSEIPEILQSLIRASKKQPNDTAKEIAEISEKLKNSLNRFEEALTQSLTTVKDLEKNFHPNEETIIPIVNAYTERAKSLIEDLKVPAPYPELLPNISELIIDMEKFKKEMMGNTLNKVLEDLGKAQKELTAQLVEGLNVEFEIPIEKTSDSLSELIGKLVRGNEINDCLVGKLLGKDKKTGIEALDKIPCKDPKQAVLPIDPVELLKIFWVNGKKEQDNLGKILEILAETIGNDEEKAQAQELNEIAQKAVCGILPESAHEALEQLQQSLQEYFPSLASENKLLQTLTQKAQEKFKELQIKPEAIENLWKALMLSHRIAEKLVKDEPPAALEDLKKTVDALPALADPAEMCKNVIKFQEISLGLINLDEEATAEEIKDIEAAAKQRVGGKGKGKMMQKKGKKILRSGKGAAKKMDFIEPSSELIDTSYTTTANLAHWIFGSKPSINRHLEELRSEKDPVLKLIQADFYSEESLDKMLNLLKKFEDEKQGIMVNSEVGKNFGLIQQQCQKLLETTGKIFNISIPGEIEELAKRKSAGDLTDVSKRIGFYLAMFFKMVKEATGVDECGEDFETAMKALKKKEAISILPFDPLELLSDLKGKSDSDVRRLKFLTGLVGTEVHIALGKDLEEKAKDILHEISPKDNQEAMECIDAYLHSYPAIEKEITLNTEALLSLLLERLCNPEPLERDVGCLLEACERLDVAVLKLSEFAKTVPSELADLTTRKSELPTLPKDLVPYLTELVRDYSKTNLALIGLTPVGPLSKEAEHKLLADINKKLKILPVQLVTEIQHLFSGPDTEDMIAVILKLDKLTRNLLETRTVADPGLYSFCIKKYSELERLTPQEIKELAIEYTNVLVGLIDDQEDPEELLDHIEEERTQIMRTRTDTKVKSTILWEDIFRGRGLDINSLLVIECLTKEQALAASYIEKFPMIFGSPEQKTQSKSLLSRISEIAEETDEARQIENYVQLRLEESELVSSLCVKTQNLYDRLLQISKERETQLAVGISEVAGLVEKNNPELKAQLEIIENKEGEYKKKNPENAIEQVLLLSGRLSLEKELQRIKDEAKPSENSSEELIKALAALESRLYSELKSLNSVLQDFSQELTPEQVSLKHLTEPQLANTIPGLLASLNMGLEGHSQLLASMSSVLCTTPIKSTLLSLQKLLETEATLDDQETETVFSGIFRLCGSSEDKAKAKKLRESRSLPTEEKTLTVEILKLLTSHLEKFLPVRTEQSKLQNKLIKDAGKMRDGIDDLDLQTEDIVGKSTREVANTILPDDSKSREALDGVRKGLEKVNEMSPTNIPDCIERITKRLEISEKLERLRRELRERSSKEINRLRGDVQDKLNELNTVKATIEGQRTQYEAQIALLQNTADLNASLVEKLTQESVEKEKALGALKNSAADLKNQCDDLKEELEKLQEEMDVNNKELRNLRRVNKEKEGNIRDLQSALDGFERNTEKSSLGDKEKSEILEKQKAEMKALREELAMKTKVLDEREDELAGQERTSKKLEIEKENLEKDLEKVTGERNKLKVDLMKINTEKSELEENMKMNQGVNPDEIKHLERILNDKQEELDEAEANLKVARRYQLLYPELTLEKQEIESKLKDAVIDSEEAKQKLDGTRQENEQMRFKLASLENLQKDAAELAKEKDKLQFRLNYLEQSASKDPAETAKRISEEIANKDSQLKDLLEQIEKLKKELKENQEKHEKSLVRSFLVRLCHTFKEMQAHSFRKWRVKETAPGKEINFEVIPVPAAIDLSDSEKLLVEQYSAADSMLAKLNHCAIEQNLIILSYKSLENKSDRPMSYINVFKFLEELMDKKFELDKQSAIEGKELIGLPDFVFQHLLKTFGIQPLALKFLGQFIPGLHEIYSQGQEYAIFYARLLQIFHGDPVPFSLALYLVKARMDFHPLIDRYERIQQEQGKKSSNYDKSAYEAAGTGGLAQLGDVVELVYTLFSSDKESGEKALELMKPGKVSIEDFVAFKICHKMAKIGKTPEMIFAIIDKDQGGTIDVGEFIEGTKEDLDLWISDTNITKLLVKLDKENKGEISKEAFMEKINMKFLIECNKNPAWVVTKASFLIALLEVYKFKQRKMAAHLYPICESAGNVVEKEEFVKMVEGYEPNLSTENAEKLFEEAKRKNGPADFDGISEVVSKYGLGDLKAFKVRELTQELTKRKLGYRSSQDESISIDTRRTRTSVILGDIRIDRDEEEKTIIRKKVTKKLVKRN